MKHTRTPQSVLTLALIVTLVAGASFFNTVTAQALGPGAQVDFRDPGTNTWRKGGTIKECSEAMGRCSVESWSATLNGPSNRGYYDPENLRASGGESSPQNVQGWTGQQQHYRTQQQAAP